MDAGDLQAGVLALEILRRLFRHAGSGPQEEQGFPALRHPGHEPLGEADAGNPALQGCFQHLRAVDDPDAVGQHQVRAVDGLPGLGVLPADLNNLRVGGRHVVGPLGGHQADALGHRLVHGNIVKAYAQHVDPHRRLLSDPHNFYDVEQYSIYFPACP